MKYIGLLCLLAAALPLGASARTKPPADAMRREFKQENLCPSTGAIEAHECPGWTIGYFTPLCAGGLRTKQNMHWITTADAQLLKSVNGKHCKNLKHSPKSAAPAY
jgi:hypothetical protein